MGSVGAPPSEWPRSPELEKRWGPARPFGPDERIHRKPGIGYRDPKDPGRYVDIVWEDPSQPKEIRDFDGKRASDGKLTLMGRSVDFYGSGKEEPEISTQPIELTSPSGRKEWYSFQFSSKEHLDGRNLPAFVW